MGVSEAPALSSSLPLMRCWRYKTLVCAHKAGPAVRGTIAQHLRTVSLISEQVSLDLISLIVQNGHVQRTVYDLSNCLVKRL